MPDFDDDAKDAAVEFAKMMAMKFMKSAGSSCGAVIGIVIVTTLLPAAPASAAAIPLVIAIKDMIDDFNT